MVPVATMSKRPIADNKRGLKPSIKGISPYASIYFVTKLKWSFLPISASDQNFNPRNTSCIPVVKIVIFPDLDKKSSFPFRHYLENK
jgi:hypothetical protein